MEVVIPIQTIGFYNYFPVALSPLQKVVIPIQTIGFYNPDLALIFCLVEVVIPIQTISFYNLFAACGQNELGCHTYPNDKLLQPFAKGL